jgi:CheY-like chemotaxis protein
MARDNSIDAGAITTRLRTLSDEMPLTVLVVDDDELERALISDRLEYRGGVQVAQASNGSEALNLLDARTIQVLIVDWMMPGMDGIELTERLRARGMSDLYVIMLTSKDGDVDYERGYQAGVDDYLSKKIRDPELLARVHTAVTTWSLRRELRETRAALAAATGGKSPQA